MLKNLSVTKKISLVFVVITLMILVLGLVNAQTARIASEIRTKWSEHEIPQVQALHSLRFAVSRLTLTTSSFGSLQDEALIESTKAELLSDLNKLTSSEQEYMRLINRDSSIPDDRRAALASLPSMRNDISSNIHQLIELKEQGAPQSEVIAQTEKVISQEEGLSNAIEAIITSETSEIATTDEETAQAANRLGYINFWVTAFALVYVVLLGWMIAVIITNRIKKLRLGAIRIANGDFTYKVDIKSGDEFGQTAQSFNQMGDRLQESYNKLVLEKKRHETLLQSMTDGIIALDHDGTVLLTNKAALNMLNLPDQDSAIGKSIFDIFPLHSTSTHRKIAKKQRPEYRTLSTGEASSEVFEFRPTKNSDDKEFLGVSVSPVVLHKTITGLVLVIRDVTKEREIDRMKTEFISLASHQLRTPLSAIRWFGEMLLNGDGGELNEEQKELAVNMMDSTHRMIDLVNSLLNISRIESGRIIIDPRPTDIKELVEGIVTDLKAKIAEREQNIAVSVHSNLPKINLDPSLIGQVYMNLLTNAIKYTPRGGDIAVIVSKKDDFIVTQVSDSGFGIPKKQHGQVFQKFFRAENVISVETDGNGLGLYLIKAIVESSGGEIWFESEENKGTTFWFSLPMSGMKAQEGEVSLDT